MARGPLVMAQTKETRAHMHTHTYTPYSLVDNKTGDGDGYRSFLTLTWGSGSFARVDSL